MTSHLTIGVLDDMRELPYDKITPNTAHCKTNEEWFAWMDSLDELEPIVVVLDHDAGGVAFGMETFRQGITELVDRHLDDKLDVIVAYIVTMNPAGQKWIISEMERGEIDYEVDVGGRTLGMKADWGF